MRDGKFNASPHPDFLEWRLDCGRLVDVPRRLDDPDLKLLV
ncbi:MAG: hypothetical protein OSB61_05620 [Verrucomicrobiota bacterium]|nr:hypothetical protein [Verrucomicrobiota bacterium]